MRRFLGLIVFLTGCMAAAGLATAMAGDNNNFSTHLAGRNEVPPRGTQAQGQDIFHVNEAGTALEYQLIVANLQNVTQAHIHCGAPGVNGPIVVFLFGLVLSGVTENGILAEGTITATNLIARPDSAQCPGGVANFSQLIEKIRTGQAYVNAHTLLFPGGEIRGELR